MTIKTYTADDIAFVAGDVVRLLGVTYEFVATVIEDEYDCPCGPDCPYGRRMIRFVDPTDGREWPMHASEFELVEAAEARLAA